MAVDAALLRLRRMWQSPAARTGLAEETHRDVDLSTVYVVEALARLEQDATEPTVTAVATAVGVERSTGSRLIDRAVQAGCVARGAAAGDGRKASIQLTEDGRDLLATAADFRLGYLRRLVGDWSATDRADLARLLHRLADAVGQQPRQETGCPTGG